MSQTLPEEQLRRSTRERRPNPEFEEQDAIDESSDSEIEKLLSQAKTPTNRKSDEKTEKQKKKKSKNLSEEDSEQVIRTYLYHDKDMAKTLADPKIRKIMKDNDKTEKQIEQHIKYKKQQLNKSLSTGLGHDKRDKTTIALDDSDSGEEARPTRALKPLSASLSLLDESNKDEYAGTIDSTIRTAEEYKDFVEQHKAMKQARLAAIHKKSLEKKNYVERVRAQEQQKEQDDDIRMLLRVKVLETLTNMGSVDKNENSKIQELENRMNSIESKLDRILEKF